ncbi:MAG: hypothetical protein KatS3mg033_0634 [Thermonema sp.]|uniref:hypothetical protein n=1 Tax=Thermonema sp. TaxID=2231181 RepID=UPI0021DEA8D0|nr:hypothetical protein [Thermonema sp.]GIV38834.1 MAG: hypothetical protein KatS3mg033_0634 [Thermonema sp.]
MWRIAHILTALSLSLCMVQAQNNKVLLSAYVSNDSLSIGERLFYSLVVHHPDTMQLFFPQRVGRIAAPLTLLNIHYAPSMAAGELVKDSVTYELTLLERLDSVKLQFPVYGLALPDTLQFLPPAKILYFKSLLPSNAQADTLELKMEVPVPALSARPLYLWWAVGGLLSLWLLWRLLVPLRRYALKLWLLYQWDRRWHDYEVRVFGQGKAAIRALDLTAMEEARRQWMEFMELLRGQALKSLTSAELAALWQNEALKEALNCLDKAIYGGHFEPELPQAWMTLHRLAAQEYELMIDKLKKDKDAVKAVRFTLFR